VNFKDTMRTTIARSSPALLLPVLLLPVGCRGPAAAFSGPIGPKPLPADLARARGTLEKMLIESLLPFWYPETIDRERGGYRLNHDASGEWLGPADKAIVTQARNVWFFARLSRSPHGRPEHLAAARHGYEFLRSKMWDPENGGFFWAVDSTGEVPTRPEKHLYGQAFGLYALSEYAAASGDGEALALARQLFGLIDARAHDAVNGGYRESFLRDWRPLPPGVTSAMGLPAGLKLMNTHLHLLEALATYVRASKDPVARDRLLELIFIQSNTVVRKEVGACTDRHEIDWKPLRGAGADRISYGHDIENIWLLMDACDAAGVPYTLLADFCRSLFAYSLKHGFDAEAGGFFDSGPFGGPADRRGKVWWVQAEGLVSALRMHRLTGDPLYYDVFARTLDWIEKRQVDPKGGDWHAEVSPQGVPGGQKASAWKSAYHNGRAIIECLAVLDALGAPASPSGAPGAGR
jgi:mannose/cellobiose epimerase-like protein (N-acyl-D-glucosamine 2-epimerase family)